MLYLDFIKNFYLDTDMTDEELRQALELAVRTNKVLALENDVFERYLNRHDPQSILSELKKILLLLATKLQIHLSFFFQSAFHVSLIFLRTFFYSLRS